MKKKGELCSEKFSSSSSFFRVLKLCQCNKRLLFIVVDAIKIEFNLHKKAIKSFSSTTFSSLNATRSPHPPTSECHLHLGNCALGSRPGAVALLNTEKINIFYAIVENLLRRFQCFSFFSFCARLFGHVRTPAATGSFDYISGNQSPFLFTFYTIYRFDGS